MTVFASACFLAVLLMYPPVACSQDKSSQDEAASEPADSPPPVARQDQAAARNDQAATEYPSAATEHRRQTNEQPATDDNGRQGTQQGLQIAPERREAPARLGVMTGPSHPEVSGVRIVDVLPAGPADTAGLQQGDYLLSVNGTELRSPQQLTELIGQMRAGDDAELTVWRDGSTFDTTATLDRNAERHPQWRGYRGESRSDEAWLGVLLNEHRDADVQGAVVTHVYPGGPASQAGIRDGDRIVAVNGNEIQSADQLVDQIRQHAPGDELALEVMRSGNGEPQAVRIQAGNRGDFVPSSPSPEFQHNPIFELPEHVMRLEHERRMAEHDERIEGLLLEVIRELRDLRRDVDALKGEQESPGGSAPAQQPASDQPPSGSQDQTRE